MVIVCFIISPAIFLMLLRVQQESIFAHRTYNTINKTVKPLENKVQVNTKLNFKTLKINYLVSQE